MKILSPVKCIREVLFITLVLCAIFVSLACGASSSQKPADNVLAIQTKKDTCDDPDAKINCCFINMPANMASKVMTIAGKNEPGERMILTGRVLQADSITPYSNVIMYAYQTDNTGHYSKKGNETGFQKWHGHLHGWCKTDSNGYYEIHSVRPARYPGNTIPAHIHAALKLPDGSEPFYINDFVFKDDSLVNQK